MVKGQKVRKVLRRTWGVNGRWSGLASERPLERQVVWFLKGCTRRIRVRCVDFLSQVMESRILFEQS